MTWAPLAATIGAVGQFAPPTHRFVRGRRFAVSAKASQVAKKRYYNGAIRMPTDACTPAGSRIAAILGSYRRIGGDLGGWEYTFFMAPPELGPARRTPFL